MGFSKFAEDIAEMISDSQYMHGVYTIEPAPKPPFSAHSRKRETTDQNADSSTK